jgi:hypothetical protein
VFYQVHSTGDEEDLLESEMIMAFARVRKEQADREEQEGHEEQKDHDEQEAKQAGQSAKDKTPRGELRGKPTHRVSPTQSNQSSSSTRRKAKPKFKRLRVGRRRSKRHQQAAHEHDGTGDEEEVKRQLAFENSGEQQRPEENMSSNGKSQLASTKVKQKALTKKEKEEQERQRVINLKAQIDAERVAAVVETEVDSLAREQESVPTPRSVKKALENCASEPPTANQDRQRDELIQEPKSAGFTGQSKQALKKRKRVATEQEQDQMNRELGNTNDDQDAFEQNSDDFEAVESEFQCEEAQLENDVQRRKPQVCLYTRDNKVIF